ncbi:hypothetical protein DOTSEDRAFT_75357 [Dothistroma septosporum NZE10]|uniref:Peptidase M20 dimerisation domain-containing protein n=1 Tax=Dothistroma septosporum (strain NZE10 / CBS 128990) TaxID=675120 RepID=M2XJP4_DOTSN|nr:hypothetical protein DOTSEDRAFT_75357 [Dothistroma septosporum NZE10]
MKLVGWLVTLAVSPLCTASSLPSESFDTDVDVTSSKKLTSKHDLLDFHKTLMRIESISGDEKGVGDWLAFSLRLQGYSVEKQVISKDPERFNVLAWPGKTRDAQILVTSHIDTVPPFLPYHYNNTDDTIFGRGSVDAKGSVATQVIAVNRLIGSGKLRPDDVVLLFVVGEEVGGAGMRAANDLDLHPQTVIFGEPTEGKLVSGHKGTMRVSLTAKGKAGHSGYPWLGRSAIEVLVKALEPIISLGDRLPSSEKYGSTTFNLGRIEGGVAGNVIAESAKADITVRIAAGTPRTIEDGVTKAVHRAVRDFLEGELEPEDIIDIDFSGKGYGPIDIDSDIPGFEVITVNYGTDIPWLEKAVENQKRYLYGPGTIFVAHSADEKIKVSDLYGAVEGYQKILLHALGKSDDKEHKADL